MKKIINNTLLIVAILLAACNNEDKKTAEQAAPTPIQEIVGIGKVLPEGGIIQLSISRTATVNKLYKKIGDNVTKGEVLFELKDKAENIAVEAAQAASQTANTQIQIANLEVEKAKVKLSELQQAYRTSQVLFRKNAETREQLIRDSTAYQEQIALVHQLQQQAKAAKDQWKERTIQVQQQQAVTEELTYTAPQTGTLIAFDVQQGQVLGMNTTFGELAPTAPLVIEGELDEFYADKLTMGQAVNIVLVGQTEVVATGIISFVGNSLQNKSIIYETVGEAQDRRVRRFTISIQSGAEKLLINQKVECKIKL